jgi:hypothetical protein
MTQAQAISKTIERVLNAGLMSNKSDGDFHPEAIVTRAELASILAKTFKLEKRNTAAKEDIEVKDVSRDRSDHSAIQLVLKTGVMSGYREGMFFPHQKVNRAEGFAIFAQAYGVFQFSEDTVAEILGQYPDAGEVPDWAKKAIATALQEGFVNTDVYLQILPLNPMTRTDMAFALSQYLDKQQQASFSQ